MNSQAWGAGRRPRWAGPPATCTCTCPTSTRPSGARSRRARRSSCPSPTCSGATATARWRIRPATGGASPRTRKTCRRRRWPSARSSFSRRWVSRRNRSPTRDVHVSAITDAVKKLCIEANLDLEPDMLRAFDGALRRERSPAGKQVLQILKQNAEMARTRRIPYCQDTGFVVCFVELGQDVHVTGGGLDDAINDGVRQGYTEGYLRASIVRSPFDRVNTGDNTPAVIHVDVGPGATLRIMVMAKGGGCENRSKYKMLTPAEGVAGVKEWIIECVKTAGPDACPPLILGVGVGGTFEKSAILSKKALFRGLGSPNPDPQLDALEKELLDRANRPTTESRMDTFTPSLLGLGLKGTSGKGYRSQPVKDALRAHKGVYFGAIGGAGAVLSQFIKKLSIVAYEDLGTEAIRRLEVEGFPAIVINDCHGGDLYQDGVKAYAREGA